MIDYYLDRHYSSPPCWDLVTEYCQRELGLPVDRYAVINGSLREAAQLFALRLTGDAHGFVRFTEPTDGAIVLMGRNAVHHAGIYVGGSVLHALDSGTYYEPLPQIQDRFPLIEFWGRPNA